MVKRTRGQPIQYDKMAIALHLYKMGLKKNKIADILGVHPSQVTRYMRYDNARKLSPDRVLTVLQNLGIMVSLDGTNAPLTTHTANRPTNLNG